MKAGTQTFNVSFPKALLEQVDAKAAEQCGWLKDKYGVSWQVSPTTLTTLLQEGSQEQVDRMVQAFLPMKKLDIAAIEAAYRGE